MNSPHRQNDQSPLPAPSGLPGGVPVAGAAGGSRTSYQASAFRKFNDALANLPPAGIGANCHTQLLGLANLGCMAGLGDEQIISMMIGAVKPGKRHVSQREIADAVRKARGDHDAEQRQAPAAPSAALAAALTDSSVRPYTTRTWGEISHMMLPPPDFFLGEAFALGFGRVRLQSIIGQGGLGKSRMALNMARNQVLGEPFAGMPTGTRPLRHLLMGSENGLHRLQHDIRKMSAELSADQLKRLADHIALASLEAPDDPYVSLNDPTNVERWRATIAERAPEVLWVDPWGDVQAGDHNSDADSRFTIATLTKLLGERDGNRALVILHHARTGAGNIGQALGYDSANFGKNSKALYSCARCVLNLAPGNESENPPVVVVCAKNNDAPRPPPFALELNPETMLYHVIPDFDLDAWITDVRDRASNRRKTGSKRLSEADAITALGNDAETAAGVRRRLRDAGATRDEADDLVKRVVASGTWEEWRPRTRHTPTYIGTPAALRKCREAFAKQQQRELAQ